MKTVKFEDLSKEKQIIIKKAGAKFILSGLITGANHGGLIIMSNLLLFMVNGIYLHSQPLLLIACVLVDVKLLRMMNKSQAENGKKFAATIKKVLDQE